MLVPLTSTKPKILAIVGPTATGKSLSGIELAKRFGGEVINFDSLSFYHELQISSARVKNEEMDGITHHLVATHSIKKPLNAFDFTQIAHTIIQDCFKRGKKPILVGGSGFYLKALFFGMVDSMTSPDWVKKKSDDLYLAHGIAPFIDELKLCDQEILKRLSLNDHYRLRRALEHFWATGTQWSKVQSEKAQRNLMLDNQNQHGWDTLLIYLDLDKNRHWDKIKLRTKKMFHDGIVEEIQSLINQGFTGKEKPLMSIGPKEVISYLKGEISSLAECEELINISTRQLAKAQRTWFKSWSKKSFAPDELDGQVVAAQNFYQS